MDVFFVISGYLIIGMISGKIAKGTFSLKNFYLRRIRRLMPAIFTTLIGVLFTATLLMTPATLLSVAKNAIWSALSVVNFTLAGSGSDYFATDYGLNPLLHFWSLAVEEQFYFVFPFIAFAFARVFNSETSKIVTYAVLAAISFLAAEWLVRSGQQSWAYYMMPTRFGELLLGGMLALLQAQHAGKSQFRGNNAISTIISLSALIVILWTASTLTGDSRFPGFNALPACLATVALIHFGSSRWMKPVLANPLSTYVGRLSYSLYLVHWPVFVFSTYYLSRSLTGTETALMIALCFVLSMAMHHGVENPVRFGKQFQKRNAFRLIVPMASVTTLLAGVILITQGLPQRLEEDQQVYLADAADFHRNNFGGVGYPTSEYVDLGRPDIAPSFLFIGDSSARQLFGGFDQALRDKNLSALAYAQDGCSPIPGYQKTLNGGSFPTCERFLERVNQYIESNPIPVVIALSWNTYSNSVFIDTNGIQRKITIQEYLDANLELLQSFRKVGAPQVIALSEISSVVTDISPMECVTRPSILPVLCKKRLEISRDAVALRPVSKKLLELTNSVETLSFFDISNMSCQDEKCSQLRASEVLFSDTYHLSKAGSSFVAPALLEKIFMVVEPNTVSSETGTMTVAMRSSISVDSLPSSESPIDINFNELTPLPYVQNTNEDASFQTFQSENRLIFSREFCESKHKPFYITVQFYPTDINDLPNPGRTFLNADFKPIFYEDGDRCWAMIDKPEFDLRQVYVGQTEKNLGRQWLAKIEGEAFN